MVNLGDFGIAKGLDNTLANAKTQIGTPYYLSPEICQGRSYSYATDVRLILSWIHSTNSIVLHHLLSFVYL